MELTINIKNEYGYNISSKQLAEKIYTDIKNNISESSIILDFDSVTSITTYCASQIFGQLYFELGETSFIEKIKIINASKLIKIIVHEGILGYMEKQNQS